MRENWVEKAVGANKGLADVPNISNNRNPNPTLRVFIYSVYIESHAAGRFVRFVADAGGIVLDYRREPGLYLLAIIPSSWMMMMIVLRLRTCILLPFVYKRVDCGEEMSYRTTARYSFPHFEPHLLDARTFSCHLVLGHFHAV